MTHNNLIKSNKKEERKNLQKSPPKKETSKGFTSRTASLPSIFLMYFENDLK